MDFDAVPRQPLLDNMRRYGGNFVSKLADAMGAADPINYNKICSVFPELVSKYVKLQDHNPYHE